MKLLCRLHATVIACNPARRACKPDAHAWLVCKAALTLKMKGWRCSCSAVGLLSGSFCMHTLQTSRQMFAWMSTSIDAVYPSNCFKDHSQLHYLVEAHLTKSLNSLLNWSPLGTGVSSLSTCSPAPAAWGWGQVHQAGVMASALMHASRSHSLANTIIFL